MENQAAPKVTKSRIDELMSRVQVHTTTYQTPTPHVTAFAWLDESFYLGVAVSKAVNPKNFNEELGIKYATEDVLKIAEEKLWELEGYRIFSA